MNATDARMLCGYNQWANHRLLAAANQLAPSDFIRDLGASHCSVGGTLAHILLGEWRWFQFWAGPGSPPMPDPERLIDPAALTSAWAQLQLIQLAWLGTLTDEVLSAALPVVAVEALGVEARDRYTWQFPLAHTLQHLLTHSAYHRGQVVTLMRQLGHTPPNTDFLPFVDRPPASEAV